ncbi:MAG: zinc-ribbon domain-containing protein, partial [Cyanobium sp. LacPavin_0920_WC12_MAG_62_9]|nr:zinc-ribbon domain-containing protein [Cyanobium sp. LacPavin_0920_WC12_MAG_62_9]
MAGSSKSLEWKCEKGHIWQSIPVSRVRQETGCLVCLGKQVHKGFNDLATTHPEIAVQANGWDPTLVIAGSNKKLPWKCELGHIWDAQPNDRTGAKSGCPVCANSRVEIGYNDLATTHPEIAAQVFEWDPRTVVAGSNKSKLWKCKFGHIWKSQVISRTSQKTGCLVCANKQVQIGFNDLATTHPNIAEEASGWNPTNVIAGSERRLAWKCKLGHSYKSTVKSRAISGTSCPICSGNQVLRGFNDLTTTHPDLAIQAVGWNSDDYISGSHPRKLWRCDLGHEWFAQIKSRALTGNNCPICGNFQVLPGFNDLATTHPELSQQAFNWDPTTVVSGSSQKRKWICPIMHTWTASINSRTNQSNGGGSGCPSCAVTGFDPNKDGYFYFLEHLNWEMYQIGITNHPGDRLKSHNKLGWDALELRGPMDGHLTQQWETAILRMLKAKGADLSNDKVAGKFDGYSEAWSK